MSQARMWIMGTLAVAVGGALWLSGMGSVTGAGENKAISDGVDKIAAALQKGDKEGAKKQADALAKKIEDFGEAMDLFKPRKKGGLGVGDMPGAIMPDGIEQMLLKIGRDAPAASALAKNAGAYEQMGYRIAAIGLVAHAKAPTANQGKKTVKDWHSWSEDTVTGGLSLAAAAKAKGAQDVKTTASKINNACNSCHSIFRD